MLSKYGYISLIAIMLITNSIILLINTAEFTKAYSLETEKVSIELNNSYNYKGSIDSISMIGIDSTNRGDTNYIIFSGDNEVKILFENLYFTNIYYKEDIIILYGKTLIYEINISVEEKTINFSQFIGEVDGEYKEQKVRWTSVYNNDAGYELCASEYSNYQNSEYRDKKCVAFIFSERGIAEKLYGISLGSAYLGV